MVIFDKIFLINLDRRTDRLNQFINNVRNLNLDWEIIRFSAIEEEPPSWYKTSKGAWGCLQSHTKILERAIKNKYRNILIFEDDAVFCPNFASRLKSVNVPSKWDMLYLGGQPLMTPIKVNSKLSLCSNVNRTHAYAINNTCYNVLYNNMTIKNRTRNFHVDSIYGELHRNLNTYICTPCLVGQSEGLSDINNKVQKERFWA